MSTTKPFLNRLVTLLKNRWQRTLNTVAIWFVLSLTMANQTGLITLGDQISQLERQLIREQEEIAQLVIDEGYRSCPYDDSLGKGTVGFGHLIVSGEDFRGCLTPTEAIGLLRQDYSIAKGSVEKRYPWAKGEVKLVLTNMTFQMGAKGVSKFKMTISALRDEKYDTAAAQMLTSTWAKQTKSRAVKLAGRIMNLGSNNNKNN